MHFIPILTTLLAIPFSLEIYRRYRAHPERLHLLWWALGIATYGVGTFTESLTTLLGWREPIFRAVVRLGRAARRARRWRRARCT